MAAPAIIVKDLHKSFSGVPVLTGVELEFRASAINFIIGQSGSGKSVLLKLLTGLIAPNKGEIWYDGLQMVGQGTREWSQLRLRSALLFQDGALFDSMSVGENVSFPLRVHQRTSLSQAEQLARLRLRELDMDGAYDYRTSELSAGEKKRVALARALILEPEIVFFDEPTTGLDPLLSAQVDDLIRLTSKQTRATLVVVSHDITATLNLADHVSMVYEGQIVLSGPPGEFRLSKLPMVRQFLAGDAEGPMGFMD